MNADSLSSDRPPTNNEKRALKSNRCASENFRSVCNSLESDFRSRKSALDASKARFLRARRGKLPTASNNRNDNDKTLDLGNRVTSTSQSLKHEKEKDFRLQQLEGSIKTAAKNKGMEMQSYSIYNKKSRTKDDCYFDNGNIAFSLGDSQRVRKISKSLGDGNDISHVDQIFSDFVSSDTNHPMPEHLAKILRNKNKKTPVKVSSKEQANLQHCYTKTEVSENKLARNRNLSRSLDALENEMIAAAHQLEANAFLSLMLKNRVGNELTHSDCDIPKLHQRRPHSSGHACRTFARQQSRKEMMDQDALSPKQRIQKVNSAVQERRQNNSLSLPSGSSAL